MSFRLILSLIIPCSILLSTNCSEPIGKTSFLKVGSLDSFSRLFPLDYSLFTEFEDNSNGKLRIQYKPFQKTFFIKKESKPVKVVKTKVLLAFDVIDSNTIFGLDSDSIYLYSLSDNSVRTISLNNTFKHNNHTYIHFTGAKEFCRVALNVEHTKLYLPTFLRESNYWKKDFFKHSAIISEIDLTTGRKEVLDYIKYPKEYLKNSYGEDYDFNYTIDDENQLVISFQALTNLYVYDLENQVFKKKIELNTGLKQKPVFDEKFLKDISSAIQYNYNTTSYYNISYEPFNKLYVRSALTPTANRKQKIRGVSYNSKFDYWLFVYDDNFRELWRHNFGDGLNPSNYYLSKEKLSIRSYKPSQSYEYFQNITIN